MCARGGSKEPVNMSSLWYGYEKAFIEQKRKIIQRHQEASRSERNKLDIARAVCKGVRTAGRERQRQKEHIESSEVERGETE